MKLFPFVSVLGAVASVFAQTIELTMPTNGQVLHLGQNFTARVTLPESLEGCIQVGIAIAIAHCNNGVCPQPSQQLGNVLYAGPWTPTPHNPGGFFQDFSLQVPGFLTTGSALVSLTHLCMIGAGPTPLLEFRNASVTVQN